MSSIVPAMRHVRGFDVARPLSIAMLVFMMLPLVFLPLASIFIFGTSNGLDKFWSALTAPEAIFALKLSYTTRFVNAPAPGIETTDTITAVSLVAKFSRAK